MLFETQNPDVNTEAQLIAVYCGTSVDRSLKILDYVRIQAACRRPPYCMQHNAQ